MPVPTSNQLVSIGAFSQTDGDPTPFRANTRTVQFTASGAHVFTGTIPLGPNSLILDIGVIGLVLWDAATSAAIKVGDASDDDGFFLSTNLKATDLLAGETNNIQHPGGLAGVFLGSEQRVLFQAAKRSVIGVVTQVGAGNAGSTVMYVTFASFPDSSNIATPVTTS